MNGMTSLFGGPTELESHVSYVRSLGDLTPYLEGGYIDKYATSLLCKVVAIYETFGPSKLSPKQSHETIIIATML